MDATIAAATSHIRVRVLSMEVTALPNAVTVSVTTAVGVRTTRPAGTVAGVPEVATAVISGLPPMTARWTVANGM